MDYTLALMCGTDFPIEECQLIIHQPKIKEIALIGEKEFFTGVQSFCINRNILNLQDETRLENINNFQIFMTIMSEKEMVDKKQNVINTLTLFFPSYKILFTPRSLIFQNQEIDSTIQIDESNFEFLQNVISDICCLKNGPNQQNSFNPQSQKAKEIAEKLMRGRQKVAEQKGTNNYSSIFSQYLSIITVGLGSMSLQDAMNLTMFQLYDLIERYTLYINWDIDIRGKLAGAKSEREVDNWMKDIHN